MEHSEEERGVALALLKRLVDQRLPRLLEMKTRVDGGEVLTEFDIDFLEGAFRDANHNRRYAIEFPEYAGIVGNIARLYEQITNKALDNQRAQKR